MASNLQILSECFSITGLPLLGGHRINIEVHIGSSPPPSDTIRLVGGANVMAELSKGAIAEAERPGATHIAVVNGDQLVDLLIRYEVGVPKTEHMVAEVVEGGLASVIEGEDDRTGS